MNARNVLRALLLCAAALCVSLPAVAQDKAQPGAPLKIGIIGTGNIGGALATHWAKAGHELLISSRHPEELQDLAKSLGPKVRVGTPREAAQFGDVILLSVPYKATPDIGRDLASELKGKVLLDTGNPYPFRDGSMAEDARKRGTGVTSKEFLPGVRLVRAFNAINAGNLARDGNRKPERLAIPLAGDDAEALQIAQRLVRDAGFDPVVVGGLARAREFDVGTKVYTKLLTAQQLRAELGLKDQ
ncbi:MAG TPA: NADPH-dependent F420 reductase [Steroidobacteraceae bacterium]|nr:NADPH-dependent F420 reductase [Steroidobacteraceae bacterium]